MQTNYEAQLKACGPVIYNHSKAVGVLIRQILHQIGKDSLVALWHVETIGPWDYHDIGKSSSDKNFWQHCTTGAHFFENAFDAASTNQEQIFCSIARDLCLYHHENWNGEGSPDRLCKTEIPLIARAGAAANLWINLAQNTTVKTRPDRLAYFESISGTVLDPEMVVALGKVVNSRRLK